MCRWPQPVRNQTRFAQGIRDRARARLPLSGTRLATTFSMQDSATRLADIMTRSVLAIPPNATLEVAYAMMREARIHHLVVMKAGRVAGVVSQRDLERARAARIPNDDDPWSIEELMSSRVVVGTPEMTVREAAGLLRGHAIGCLPIMDGKELVGIVTTSDLLDLLANHRFLHRPDLHRPADPETSDALDRESEIEADAAKQPDHKHDFAGG